MRAPYARTGAATTAVPAAVSEVSDARDDGQPAGLDGAAPASGTATAVATRPAKADTDALRWVDPATVSGHVAPAAPAGPLVARDLLADVPMRRSRAWAVPTLLLVAGGIAYVAATAAWPTTALPPTVAATAVESKATVPAAVEWPAEGSAAVGVGESLATTSADAQVPMASITKVVTVLTVLEKKPLAVGEQGDAFTFTQADSDEYWQYLTGDQSSLDVPIDGSLSYYQVLQGILLGSANNYTDRLSQWAIGDDAAFEAAANDYLARNGITGIHVVEPTGFDPRNVATPTALVQLARLAEQQPVVAEIAAMPEATLPGAGLVKNSNGIITDPGVVGLKTGTLDKHNLLSVKNIQVGDQTVQTYAAVLDQDTNESRDAASRALYSQIETALQPQVAVPAETTVATITTPWGETSSIATTADATVSLWNAHAEVKRGTKLGEDLTKGAKAGTLTVTGALGDATVDVELTKTLRGPDVLWRLTHPLQLFGLSKG